MLSRSFPPLYDVGGKRAFRFSNHLPEFGWKSIVWTTPIPFDHPIDSSYVESSGSIVFRTMQPEWWPKGFMKHTVDSVPIQKVARLKRVFRRYCALPIGWEMLLLPRASLVLSHVIERHKCDVIWATIGPPIVGIYAWVAHELSGLPLVLDFRDPWTLNYLQADKAAWVRTVEAYIERTLFTCAAQVIFTSQDTAEAYSHKLRLALCGRINTITNCFEALSEAVARSHDGPVRLVHFGHCNGSRSLATLLRALESLRRSGRWPDRGLVLLNYGRVRQDDLSLADSLGLPHVVVQQSLIGSGAATDELARADVLVLLGYGDERLHVPAKLFDYMAAGRPVLCIAPRCNLTDIVETTGIGVVADPSDVETTTQLLEECISSASEPTRTQIAGSRLSEYTCASTTRRLVQVLEAAVV